MSSKNKKPSKGSKTPTGSGPSDKGTNEPPIGYGNPPKHTQFKKGQSGNPGGRPIGSKNLKNLIYQYADKEIEVMTRDGKQTTTRREAAADKIWESMLKKPDRQMYLLYMEIEAEKEKEREEHLKRMKDTSKKDLDVIHAMLFDIFARNSPVVKKHVLEMLENGEFDEVEIDPDRIKSIYLPQKEDNEEDGDEIDEDDDG